MIDNAANRCGSTHTHTLDNQLQVLELFAGVGACSSALSRLGINYKIVDAVEIDKFAIKSFNAIHNTDFETQDITQWNKDLKVDLIVGGFPCQTFSVAGHRRGFEDMRGTLCFEMARIINKLKPKYFMFENVEGLLNHNKGETIRIILESFSSLGYEITLDLLNAKNYRHSTKSFSNILYWKENK